MFVCLPTKHDVDDNSPASSQSNRGQLEQSEHNRNQEKRDRLILVNLPNPTQPTVADLVPLRSKLPRVGEQGAGEALELPLRQAEHAQPPHLADRELDGFPPLGRLGRHVQKADGAPLKSMVM